MENKTFDTRKAGAISFCVSAAFLFLTMITYFRYGFNILFVFESIQIAGLVILAYSLFTSRRNQFLAIGFGLFAIGDLLMMFRLGTVIVYLISILIWAGAAVISAALLTNYLPKMKEQAAKLWFLPAALQILLVLRRVIMLFMGYPLWTLLLQIAFILGLFFSLSWVV